MNKTELISAVAATAGVSKKDAAAVIDATLQCISEKMAEGDKIQLVGFGTFETRERAAREALNPKTKEKVAVAACKVPSFKAGKALKDAVNK